MRVLPRVVVVCVRVGMRPWYMVVRLIRSMCVPYVHPSVCRGVLWMLVSGVSRRRSGGDISSPEYHWRRVLCIMAMAGGGWRLRES